MRPLMLLSLALFGCGEEPTVGSNHQPLTSALWGAEGEAFVDDGRLMDWSYAGYGASERAIPDVPVVANAADFGAVGDGETDDGAAIEAAISSAVDAGGGAVFLPEGRYRSGRRFTLSSGVVLRGAGAGQTTLYFPDSLSELYGGDYSFGGGFIEATGSQNLPELTAVTNSANRGERVLQVADGSELVVGEWILLRQRDVDGTLMRRLHEDHVDGGSDNVGDIGLNFPSRISAIDGDMVTLERALIVDVDPMWSPTLYRVAPALTEVGVEALTIEFPVTTYPGHFNEEGYNGIHFRSAWNAWVRDVTVLNADYGVNFTRSFFCTAEGVTLDTTGDRGELTGHHGLNNGFGGDNLFIDFDIRTTFIHDLTNEWYAHGVVFARGRGDDLCMDHHRAAPFTTLWTELDLGAGNRPWRSGGRGDRGPHTAAFDTQWNIRAERTLGLPNADYGPTMTFVGFDTDDSIPDGAIDWYLEAIEPAELEPANLWVAMVERRLGPTAPPDPPDGGTTDPPDPADGFMPSGDGGASPGTDAGASSDESGGCSVTGSATASVWTALVLVARRRRRKKRSIREVD